jgi:ABC-type glycerol-3-phosphate transport system permease component
VEYKRIHRRLKIKRTAGGTLFWIILTAVILIVIVLPFFWMLKTAFEPRENLFKYPPALFPAGLRFGAFIDLFTKKPMWTWMKNSLFVSTTVMILSMFFSTLAGYSLSRYKNPLNNSIGFLILITQMLPGTLFLLPIYTVFTEMNLINTYTGFIIALTTFSMPICIWMLKGYFDSIPVEIEQAAMIDGCGKLKALMCVVLPLCLPGYVCTAIFAFIVGWNEYMLPFMLMTQASKWMLANGLASFIGEFSTPWNMVMAAAFVYTVPAVVLFMCLQKYLIQGLTAGAVKG